MGNFNLVWVGQKCFHVLLEESLSKESAFMSKWLRKDNFHIVE